MDRDPFSQWILENHPNLVKYSPDALKKLTKVLDILNMNKNCLILYRLI